MKKAQSKSTFLMHCGAHLASVDEVANVVTPAPTATHFPIPHIAIYENFRHRLEETGLRLVDEKHALQTKVGIPGCNYFGLFELESEREDYNLVAGIRNSHGKLISSITGLGDKAFICDNLSFNITFQTMRKHTKYIMRDMPQLVARAVANLMNARLEQDYRINGYKKTVIGLAEADHLIMEMARARVVAANKVIPVYEEFVKPRHDEHLDDDGQRTVWTLRNAVTEVYKDYSVFSLPKRCHAMHGILDGRAMVGGEFEANILRSARRAA